MMSMINSVNDMNSRGKKKKENISNIAKQQKQKPKVWKPKKVGSKERLASPKPSKPRSCLRWLRTGRIFDLKGKINASSESESQSNCSNGDNACTSNPSEPTIKRFPNSTSFLGRNNHVAAILGFGDLQSGNILITGVYFVEGLRYNLFSVRQFCDLDLEVTFKRNTCFDRNLEGVDLLKGNRTTNLYTINLHEMASASPICLMARATSTKSWLWHQRLSHLSFDTINDLAKNDLVTGLSKFKYHKEHVCPSCEQGKSKRASHPPKLVPNSKQRLHLLHMDLCGPMRITSINGKCSGLDLPYAPSIITTQKPTEDELDLLFEAMYDDHVVVQPSTSPRTVLAAQAPQVRQTPTASTTIADTALTPTISSSQATNILSTSQDVDGLKTQQQHQHAQQQENHDHSNPKQLLIMFQMLCSMTIRF
nr:retrovirus-related Pol polyprotein from transposon TNT 1-94 [Tanacetum cinerariifolium]